MTAALTAGGGASSPPAPASLSKGKAKMVADAAAEVWTCGICLAKSREAIRGELDCCAHHFCFVCIMAWGRVESRCPFCKARFRTIRRPPVPGRFPSERVVTVPERNQVYLGEGNGSSTVADAYANTICSVCKCCQHDELLMLCDLCDSAAHTYCVGLGTVVPEGDWFCEDCAASKEEHSRCHVDDEGLCKQGEFEISIDVPTVEATASSSAFAIVDDDNGTSSGNVLTPVQSSRISMDHPVPSIYDIVGDDYTTNAGTIRLRGNSENAPSRGATSAGSQCPKSARGRDNGLASYHALIRMEVERTRALRKSRNRDKRIRELRESWASLRDGSVGFRTHISSRRTQGGIQTISAVTEHQHFTVPTVVCRKNGASGSTGQLSLASLSEETSTSLGHGDKTSQKDTRDVRKAWKMLQIAKSPGEKKISNKPSSLNSCSPPFSMGNRSTSYSPIDTILGLKNQNLTKVAQKDTANCGLGSKMESAPTTENSRQYRSLPESSRLSVHERIISFQDRINEESLNGEVAASNKSDTLDPVKCILSSGLSTFTSSLQLGPSSGSQPTVMVNPGDSSAICVATTDGISSSATIQSRKSSGHDHHKCKRKLSSEKCHDQISKRSRSSCKIAKTEISSLAIRELKVLKIDKTYGSDRFKEVARTATHTVLAACGFEHSPARSLPLSRPICEHSSEVKLLESSVTANCCTECLRDFVKEAINLALSCRQMDKIAATS
ncbi:hypothetical protein QOZ80_6AG0517320 [Eleusine coracana subsp. coracana]|nr:hypothetical protein QOZ80_6AG0517320 [Eleusine coracana subsp. coracana]